MVTSQQWLTLLSILHQNTSMFAYIEPKIMAVLRSYYKERVVTELQCSRSPTTNNYMLRVNVERVKDNNSLANNRIHIIVCVGVDRPYTIFSEQLNCLYDVIKQGIREYKIDDILQ